ncbi:MAG TPA: DNA ligase D [Acidobacteriota bacterium]|nr:DNA ligase D [Acidobacteriota bacterium]
MPGNDKDAHSRLAKYRKKRRAQDTPEPFPTGVSRPGEFVIHLHAARRQHYDLRLEVDGVLRCWAVPNGPSLDTADKRLAVETEDHPVEYLDFEDVIPEGNYGAGAMIVWDRGRWVQREDDQTGDNKLLFDLYGYKLRGRWTLVRTKRNPKEWLLIKKADGFARRGDEAKLPQESVYSGLTVEQLGGATGPAERVLAELAAAGTSRQRVNASSLELMLAKTADAPFSRDEWLFELKYDGYRLVVGVDEGDAFLRYRNGGNVTEIYPDLMAALVALPYRSVVLDGEVVVLGEDGRPSFSRLTKRARLSRGPDIRTAALHHPATYFVFDLIELDGYDLRRLPLSERKGLLRRVVPQTGPVRYTEHIERQGAELFEQVAKMGLEGLMAKRGDSRYRAGRSDHWLKIRADRQADLVIVGFVHGKGSRKTLGALLVAVAHEGELVYVGRVGSGLRERQINEIHQQLLGLRNEVAKPPVELPEYGTQRHAKFPKPEETVWVRPELVCEVRFKEITPEGLLRHPVFSRLRLDKSPAQCDTSQLALVHAQFFHAEENDSTTVAPLEAGRTVITRPEKVFWPHEGYTKGDLIDYYRAVSEWLLPYLEDRPLVLDRYPDGIEGKSFFQKHAPHFTPDWVRTVTIHSGSGERDIDYFVVDDPEGLIYMANAAAIPLHIWSSRTSTIDHPDWAILDFDPKEAPFGSVVQVARRINQLCRQIGLSCYAKTSGKTGMHVLVPLGRQVTYEHGRMLADLLALIVSRRYPELATVNRPLQARGGRAYIDAVQNGAGRLLVSPLCVRPFRGATVSTPLRWREVGDKLDMHRFTIKTVPRRLRRMKQEPMQAILGERPDLLGALQLLSELEKAE